MNKKTIGIIGSGLVLIGNIGCANKSLPVYSSAQEYERVQDLVMNFPKTYDVSNPKNHLSYETAIDNTSYRVLEGLEGILPTDIETLSKLYKVPKKISEDFLNDFYTACTDIAPDGKITPKNKKRFLESSLKLSQSRSGDTAIKRFFTNYENW